MTERCRAKNPATCRTHGAGHALAIIDQHINAGDVQPSALFHLAAMKKAAENYAPENTATGMTVEYEDGTSEVFYGEATDPYHASDWSFTSATNSTVLKGYQYSDDREDYDDANTGRRTVRQYAEEMNEMLVGNRPLLAEGPDSVVGKKVARVTVL